MVEIVAAVIFGWALRKKSEELYKKRKTPRPHRRDTWEQIMRLKV